MKIAVVSSTTIPATFPDDPFYTTTYGSEVYNAVLVRGLWEKGYEIEWYAPIKSSIFKNYKKIHYHPIIDSRGAHLADERLEKISFDHSKTEDILDCDFLIDMSKQAHVTEELSLFYGFKRYCNYRSGYQDWAFPLRCEGHFVTHCEYFRQNFIKNGFQADVCRFGIPDFWHKTGPEDIILDSSPIWTDIASMVGDYFLYPHRPNPEKGLNTLMRLAREFPRETFVISTATPFEDHKRELARVREEAKHSNSNLNIKFIEIPQNKKYHYYRRALMRNCKAVLSLFQENNGYMDTGGLVSAEAVKCGAPVIVTRSPGSEELLGSLEDKGVTFVDGYESAKMAIRYNAYETRPNPSSEFMSISTYVEDYENVMDKYK